MQGGRAISAPTFLFLVLSLMLRMIQSARHFELAILDHYCSLGAAAIIDLETAPVASSFLHPCGRGAQALRASLVPTWRTDKNCWRNTAPVDARRRDLL